MATHSSILAWRIPWTEELGGLQSMGLQRVGHNSATNTFHINWRFRIQQTQAPCPLTSSGPSLQGLAQVYKVTFCLPPSQLRECFQLSGTCQGQEKKREAHSKTMTKAARNEVAV